MKTFVLASASPRRIEMIRNAGYDPVVMPASIIESLPYEMDPETATMYLALQKASAVYAALEDGEPSSDGQAADSSAGHPSEGRISAADATILAADTVVVLDGQIIGKPQNEAQAFQFLSAMRGRSHHVITGCCIIKPLYDPETGQKPQKICFYEDTEVWFKDYTDEELQAYVNTPEPYDKAGGYAIQGSFGKYIDHIDGDFDNVVGLPLTKVLSYL